MDYNLQIDFNMSQRVRPSLVCFYLVFAGAIISGCASGAVRPTGPSETATSAGTASELSERLYDRFFLEGSLLQMQGKYDDAIREYRRALRFDSTRSSLHFALASCYRMTSRPDSALRHGRSAVAADSSNIDARMLLAEMTLYAGLVEESTANYDAIVRLDPENIQARVMIARNWLRRDPFRAIEEYEGLRRIVGDDPDILYNLAELYLNNGLSDRAIEVIRKILHVGADRVETYGILAQTLLNAGRYEDAMLLLDETGVYVTGDSTRERFYIEQIDDLHERLGATPRLVPGLASYGAKLALETRDRLPRSWRAQYESGMLLYRLDAPGADTSLARALANPAVPPSIWNEAAEMLIESGEHQIVVRELAPLGLRYGDDPSVMFTLGRTYSELGRSDPAERYLRRAVAVDPGNSEAWLLLGDAYLDNGKAVAGRAALKRAIQEDDGNIAAHGRMALMLAELNENLEEALRLAQRALSAEPENERFLETIGLIYYRLDDPRRALGFLERAARAGGAGPETLELLGDIQNATGDRDAARATYRQALVLSPDNARLHRKIESIEGKE